MTNNNSLTFSALERIQRMKKGSALFRVSKSLVREVCKKKERGLLNVQLLLEFGFVWHENCCGWSYLKLGTDAGRLLLLVQVEQRLGSAIVQRQAYNELQRPRIQQILQSSNTVTYVYCLQSIIWFKSCILFIFPSSQGLKDSGLPWGWPVSVWCSSVSCGKEKIQVS